MLILLVALLADLFAGPLRRRWFHPSVCVLMALQIGLNLTPDTRALFGGMYVNTPFTSIVKSILSAGTLLIFLQSGEWLGRKDTHYKQGEFYVLTLATLLGMFFMVSAGHFLIFYIGLEMASIPMACLVALDKYRHHSAEAGAKFILSTMFSSALLLYGLSFIYGTSGTLYFADLPAMLQGSALQQFALVLFLAGMGFKMSLVPFHLWTADVYQGGTHKRDGLPERHFQGSRCRGLGHRPAFCVPFDGRRLDARRGPAFRRQHHRGQPDGRFAGRHEAFHGLQQHLAGRLYPSGCACRYGSGHGLAGVLCGRKYVVANVAVFAVISTVEQHAGGQTGRDAYRGLYRTNPRLTLVLTLALFSLGGIPPFAGFFSKFFIFAAAFAQGWWLVVFLALVNTIVSLFYYLLVVKAMYISEPLTEDGLPAVAPLRSHPGVRLTLALCTAGICLLGVASFVYEGLARWAGMM